MNPMLLNEALTVVLQSSPLHELIRDEFIRQTGIAAPTWYSYFNGNGKFPLAYLAVLVRISLSKGLNLSSIRNILISIFDSPGIDQRPFDQIERSAWSAIGRLANTPIDEDHLTHDDLIALMDLSQTLTTLGDELNHLLINKMSPNKPPERSNG